MNLSPPALLPVLAQGTSNAALITFFTKNASRIAIARESANKNRRTVDVREF